MEPEIFPSTRRSLITRLKNWDDQESWQEFFKTYWKLIYSVAIKSGLTEAEAEDVVQETVVTVAKTMAGYRYEPEKCRFKTWLMRITRMRIVDQFRKRGPEFAARAGRTEPATGTPTEERIPDPTTPFVETLWDEEWLKNIVDAAMDRVKRRVKPVHYQIFYLTVVKHRVATLVKKEIQQLEKNMNLA